MVFESYDIFAEVGAALAGFATIVGVLREDVNHRHNAFGVVQTSLFAMIFALLPRLVAGLWSCALLFLLCWSALWTVTGVRNARLTGAVVAVKLPPWVIAGNFLLACAGTASAALILFDVWPDRVAQLYGWCLMCSVLTACHLLVETARALFLEPVPSATKTEE